MSATVQRTPKSGRQSLFYQDLATPVSSRRGKFNSPGQAAAVSALWRENFGGSDLPPPPMYTLEDRSDVSPESGIPDFPASPETKSDMRTPPHSSGLFFSSPTKSKSKASTSFPETKSDMRTPPHSSGLFFSSPTKSKSKASTSFALSTGQQNQQGSASMSWWGPSKSGGSEQDETAKGSPVEGVVQPGALITLPPPREVARPEVQRNTIPMGNLNDEEWVTVYGFPPGDTNLVLREFEKCGVILKHVPGPREANWMHILYQNHLDAQRALSKNGIQINGVLIVGVKPVDPVQHSALNERLNNQGFMPLPPPSSGRTPEFNTLLSPRHIYPQNSASRSSGAIASPAKSVVSKIIDLMFGV